MLVMTLVLVANVQAIESMPTTPAKIDVSAGALTKQDGNYSAIVMAIVKDPQGKPSPGANVYFNASKGNLTTPEGSFPLGWLNFTDSNGKASAVLTLAASESVTVTVRVGDITATVTVSPQPSTISVTAQPTAVVTPPPLPTPGATTQTTTPAVTTPAVTTPGVTATTPAATTPKATTPPAAGATTPSTPGFGVVILLISICLVLRLKGGIKK